MEYNRKDRTRGVYGLWEDGKCLYIGSTTRMYKRWMEHRTNIKRSQCKHTNIYPHLSKHSHIIYGMIEECDNYKEREVYYINTLSPSYNVKKR
tara:strand:- start:3409 stop:3687 length:279 start_codon:yes stop_codon:yes gene_type:complete